MPLRDYQYRAVDHLHGTGEPGAGLFMDMGLGKTAVVLEALTPDHLPALVLAPKRVAETVWHAEAAKWRPDLEVVRAVGTPLQRRGVRAINADVTVMTRDTVTDIDPAKHGYKTVVLDELSGYKAKKTIRWRETRKVANRAQHVWGLTGTPASNGYIDLWAQTYMLDKGARLGTALGGYRERYFDPGRRLPVSHIVTRWDPKPGAIDSINALLDDLFVSMKSEDYLELPDVVYNEITLTLPADVRRQYELMEKTFVADLGLLGTFTAGNAGTVSGRLRQMLAGFLYEDDDSTKWAWLHDTRIEAVTEVVEGSGTPVLVLYQFIAERERLKKALPEARTINDKNVIDDWNAGKVPVLLAHPKSIGHGLNLQHGGHTAVWASLTWDLEEWLQTNKRLHRQGQENTVVIHVPIVENSIDKKVYSALARKERVQDGLLVFLSENERMLR